MWEQVALRRLFRIVNGGTPSADEQNWGDEVAWATPIDIGSVNGWYLNSTLRSLTREGVRSGSRTISAGSLILSTRAPIGYVAQCKNEIAFNQGCKGLEPISELELRYFRYQLMARRSNLVSLGAGSTFSELSTDMLSALKVAVPPLHDQRRIADYLDAESLKIDGLTSVRRRMRNILRLRRQRVVEEVLGLASELSTIPLKFAVATIGVGIVITPAKWYVELGGVLALRGLNVRPGGIDVTSVIYISQEGHFENIRSRLSAGDVVVVRTGQAGAAAMIPVELDGCNCIDLLTIRPGACVDPGFLVHFLNSAVAGSKVAEYSVGSIQAHFNVGSMKDLRFPKLDRAERERRAKRLDEIVHGIDELDGRIEQQLRLLAERRHALIMAAVAGQIDVSTGSGVSV